MKLDIRIAALILTFAAVNLGASLGASSLEAPKTLSTPTLAASVPAVHIPAAPAAAVPAPMAVPAVKKTPAFVKGAEGLSPDVLAMALDAMAAARAKGVAGRDDLLTVIDYSLPSTRPRLWVLDLAHGEVLFHELVAHGSGSGDNYATRFSNVNDSRQTSLGLFVTGGTYEGGNGYSLKLRGLDPGVNDNAEARHIVMHGAWYVSPDHASGHGRLGRSWGCPALSETVAPRVIDRIKGGTFLFSYAGDPSFQQYETAALRGSSASTSQVALAATR